MRKFLPVLACWSLLSSAQPMKVPETRTSPVVDTCGTMTLTDSYRWLENAQSPDVQSWISEQNAYSRSYLDAVPFRPAVAQSLRRLMEEKPVTYDNLSWAGTMLFALKDDGKRLQKVLVAMQSPDDPRSEHVICDPAAMSPNGTTAIDWFAPSESGSIVAVCLSQNGSEDGSVYFYNTTTGERLQDTLARVQFPTGGGGVAWDQGDRGVWYTSYPGVPPGMADRHAHQQVYYHRMGGQDDAYVIGKEFPSIAEIRLSSGTGYLLVSVANGDGGAFAHWIMRNGEWQQLTAFDDDIRSITIEGDFMYLLSHRNAPRGAILRTSFAHPDLATAATVVPQSNVAIEEFCLSKNRIYVTDQLGGPEQVRVFSRDGTFRQKLPMKEPCGVGQVIVLNPADILYSVESYTEYSSYYHYSPSTGRTTPSSLNGTSSNSLSDVEVLREVAISKDGTKVPLTILRRKGTILDGSNPTLLYGYGGFNISLHPQRWYWMRMWMDQGGVYAEATLRGGGEFGDEWHMGGNLLNKQHVFDDFTACARWLIDHHYTVPEKFAIMGASNGGLLMGATFTQHPELFRAVVSRVGIYDMMRSELSPNGAFNVTEYGSVNDSAQCNVLFGYSPYHHVVDGARYPAILMPTGDHDGRVDPMQSRKMIARVQQASTSGFPVLLRTTAHAGHGMGTSRREFLSEQTDIFSFLMDQLGMTFRQETP
jgi:prolyl oligopeptidase